MKNLLVVRLGAMGDLIHLSAALQAVKAAHPQLRLHLLTSPGYADLGAMMPGVDKIWILDKSAGWTGLGRLAQKLRSSGIDGVVNLHPSLRTWLLVHMIKPLRQITYRKEKLREKGLSQRAIKRRHAAADFYESFRQLLSLPLAEGATLIPRLKLLSRPDTVPQKPAGIQWVGMIVGVGGKRGNRAWGLDNNRALILRLLGKGDLRVLLIGGRDEMAMAGTLMAALPEKIQNQVENLCGLHDIPETARIFSQCDLVIGGDTGPMHLAAALKVPLVGIYGPTSLGRTGPLGRHRMKLLTPSQDLVCWPCEKVKCPLRGQDYMRCMAEITVDEVLAACSSLLHLNSRPAHPD